MEKMKNSAFMELNDSEMNEVNGGLGLLIGGCAVVGALTWGMCKLLWKAAGL